MINKIDKHFGLSAWAIDNRITVYIIMFIILGAGISAFVNMPREDFPEIIENKVYISSVFPGNPAEDVEKLVTEPIEDEIRDISGIQKVQSTSFNDYAMTIVEFSDEKDLEEAKLDVKDKIDAVKSDSDWPTLDTGAKVEPSVFDLNISEEVPILNINLSGNYTLQQLKDFGKIIQDKVEDLNEVKEVAIRGVNDKEVEVAVDLFKMAAAKVSFNDIVNAIANENKTISGGNVTNGGLRTNIRVIGEFKSPAEMEDIVVKYQGGNVYVRDIAEVKFAEKEKTTYAREHGQEVVMLDVKKRSGQNMIEAVENTRKIITELQETTLPNDLQLKITNDQAPRTQNQVDDLINNIIFGVILVVGVLMFFLGLRNASFVGLAIPLSMLMALGVLHLFGETMNTMVLFALVMGLGMLVDNGIVVVENVYTLINEGWDKKLAAKQGVAEIAWPIIASTATTLAAFFPLALWPGTMGKFMVFFPVTLSYVLGASLFVALIINSMLTSEFMVSEKEEKEARKKNTHKKLIINSSIFLISGIVLVILGYSFKVVPFKGFGNLLIVIAFMMWAYRYLLYPAGEYFQRVILPWMENKYRNTLNWVLKSKRPVFVMIAMVFLFFSSFFLIAVAQPEVLFFPNNEPNQIIVYIEFPEGTDIEITNEFTQKVEEKVFEVIDGYIEKVDGKDYNFMSEAIVAQVGEGAGNPNTDAGSNAEIPHKGKITVSLREFKFRRGIKSSDVLVQVRDAVQNFTGANVTVEKDAVGPPSGYPVNIEISGENYDQMMDEAERMIQFIDKSGVEGYEGLKVNVNRTSPELQLVVNNELAGSMGITNQMVGGTLRQSIYGMEASRYKPKGDDDDYPINVRLNENLRNNEEVLFNQPVTFRNQATGQLVQVPIAALVEKKKTKQFTQIKREDYKRTITVYSGILDAEGYNANKVVENIKAALNNANYTLPDGMDYAFTGEQEEQAKQMAFLSKALLYAVIGITLIIVLQFNSVSKPLIILVAILFSFIGVFYGLIVFGMSFVILMTMMGIISLAGIVVNNGIVLIDYTQLLIDRKKIELDIPENVMLPRQDMKSCIIEGGRSRLRPVLLTAITTILGLIPLAMGINIDFYSLMTEYNPKIYIGGDNVIFWGPLAWTVIFGLTFATFLTLVIVPTMQYLVNRLKFRARYRKKGYPYTNLETGVYAKSTTD